MGGKNPTSLGGAKPDVVAVILERSVAQQLALALAWALGGTGGGGKTQTKGSGGGGSKTPEAAGGGSSKTPVAAVETPRAIKAAVKKVVTKKTASKK